MLVEKSKKLQWVLSSNLPRQIDLSRLFLYILISKIIRIYYELMLRTLKILIYMGDLITGKEGVPPAVVCESPLMQARRLLYPLFRPLLRNMSYEKT